MNKPRNTVDARLYAAAEDAFTSEGGGSLPTQSENERQMAQFDIGYDGLRYHRKGYQYDKLEDAVAYARLMDSRPGQVDTGGTFVPRPVAPPTDAEQALMATLAIRFVDGSYLFEDFRYDDLSDAVNFAQRQRDHLRRPT